MARGMFRPTASRAPDCPSNAYWPQRQACPEAHSPIAGPTAIRLRGALRDRLRPAAPRAPLPFSREPHGTALQLDGDALGSWMGSDRFLAHRFTSAFTGLAWLESINRCR